MAHARRKFFELHATHKSALAEQALRYMQALYEIEGEIEDLEPDIRRRIRQEKAVPVGHDPYAYQKDVLTRLPTQRASEIAELLPHRWRPA